MRPGQLATASFLALAASVVGAYVGLAGHRLLGAWALVGEIIAGVLLGPWLLGLRAPSVAVPLAARPLFGCSVRARPPGIERIAA